MTSRKIPAAVALALGTCAGSAALAADDTSALEEVVVTAQFREQNLQATPLSITAVTGDMLELRSQTNIAEVASQAPNVTLKPQGAAFGPSMGASIRGVGQFDFNPALEPGVGIYVDDVYYATLTGSVLDLLDLERVEILRGPQGTLAGRNSIGGAVKLYSKKATGTDTGSITATYGSRDRIELRGSADFKLGENVFARISGVSKQQDGHVKRMDYGCKNPTSGVPILTSVRGDCVVGTMGDVNYDAVKRDAALDAHRQPGISASIDYTNDDRTPAGAVMVQGRGVLNATNLNNMQPVQGVTALPLSAFVVPHGSYYNYATLLQPEGHVLELQRCDQPAHRRDRADAGDPPGHPREVPWLGRLGQHGLEAGREVLAEVHHRVPRLRQLSSPTTTTCRRWPIRWVSARWTSSSSARNCA